MVTCSSIGPAVEAGAKLMGVPVLRVDQPMADIAVQTGKRIGVIATLSRREPGITGHVTRMIVSATSVNARPRDAFVRTSHRPRFHIRPFIGRRVMRRFRYEATGRITNWKSEISNLKFQI